MELLLLHTWFLLQNARAEREERRKLGGASSRAAAQLVLQVSTQDIIAFIASLQKQTKLHQQHNILFSWKLCSKQVN